MSNLKSYIVATALICGLLGAVHPAAAQSYYQGGYGGYGDGYPNRGFEYYGNGIGGGYGYQNNDGSWYNQGSDSSGGYSVGGDGSGCIYTPNWSNC
jgi:hypothetical protein